MEIILVKFKDWNVKDGNYKSPRILIMFVPKHQINPATEVDKQITTKSVVNVLLTVILYDCYGCVIAEIEELHNEKTNEFPYIFVEYADYIFVLACSIWLSVNYASRIKFSSALKFIVDLVTCVFLTNIALKMYWIQQIEFTSIVCTLTSDLFAEIHKHIEIDWIKTTSELFKTETCGRLFLTIIAMLMLCYVTWTVGMYCYVRSLIENCRKRRPALQNQAGSRTKLSCSGPEVRRSPRSPRRVKTCSCVESDVKPVKATRLHKTACF